ncbi:MAG: CBS domain-containing protein [Thermoproteus sp.]
MKVRDLIRRPPITIPRDATLLDAADALTRHGVGALVVVDREKPDVPVAVLSERDIVRAISARLPLSTPVEAFMSTSLITIDANEPLTRAAELMWMYNIRHLVVMDGGRMVGVISIRDIVNPQRLKELCR